MEALFSLTIVASQLFLDALLPHLDARECASLSLCSRCLQTYINANIEGNSSMENVIRNALQEKSTIFYALMGRLAVPFEACLPRWNILLICVSPQVMLSYYIAHVVAGSMCNNPDFLRGLFNPLGFKRPNAYIFAGHSDHENETVIDFWNKDGPRTVVLAYKPTARPYAEAFEFSKIQHLMDEANNNDNTTQMRYKCMFYMYRSELLRVSI